MCILLLYYAYSDICPSKLPWNHICVCACACVLTTIRMPEHRLPRQVLYSQLMGAKRCAGGQNLCFKDLHQGPPKASEHSPHADRISGTQQVSQAGHLCHCSFSNTPNQPRSMIREMHQETPVGGWYPPGIWFHLLHLWKSVRLKDRTRRPREVAPAATSLNPPPSHPHPWSKRHH